MTDSFFCPLMLNPNNFFCYDMLKKILERFGKYQKHEIIPLTDRERHVGNDIGKSLITEKQDDPFKVAKSYYVPDFAFEGKTSDNRPYRAFVILVGLQLHPEVPDLLGIREIYAVRVGDEHWQARERSVLGTLLSRQSLKEYVARNRRDMTDAINHALNQYP